MIYYIHKVKKDLGWEGFADKTEQTKGNIFDKLRSSFPCVFFVSVQVIHNNNSNNYPIYINKATKLYKL